MANAGLSPTSDTTLLCQVDRVQLVKRVPQGTEGARGRRLEERDSGSSRAPGSAPAAPWTAPALLASSLSQSLNQADSRASSPSEGCCHSTRERPAPPSDVTILHLSSPGGAGPPPGLGFCCGQLRQWRRRNPG